MSEKKHREIKSFCCGMTRFKVEEAKFEIALEYFGFNENFENDLRLDLRKIYTQLDKSL